MKILYVISSLKIGGAESALTALLTFFNQQTPFSNNQHTVLYFHPGPQVKYIQKLGIATHHIKGFVSPYDPLALSRLYKYIKQYKPDIIHSSLWLANILSRLIGKLLRIPVLCDIHGEYVQHGTVRNVIETMVFPLPATFIPVSHSIKNSLPSYVLKKPVHVIQNGIDIEKIHNSKKITKQQLGIHKTTFTIGTIGRLVPIKRYEFLIEAFKIFKEGKTAKLIFIGDGPERANLEALAQNHNLTDHILFIGMQQNPHRFFAAFDCFTLTSHTEGLSIALLEAMASGIPVICTNKTISHDVILHGKNGYLVLHNDMQQFVAYLNTLYRDISLRKSFGNAGKKLIEEHFPISRVAHAYVNMYTKIMKEKLAQ